jgi:hypothetical protein
MKRVIAVLPLFVLVLAVAPAAAQVPPPAERTERIEKRVDDIVKQSGLEEALENIAAVAAPELERTAEVLAGSLRTLLTTIANDPALRESAVRAAHGAAAVAEAVVVEQTSVLQELLRHMAERLEELARTKPAGEI